MPQILLTLLLAPFVLAGFMPLAARWLGSKVGWLALAGKIALYSPAYLALMWMIGMRADERAQVLVVLRRRNTA